MKEKIGKRKENVKSKKGDRTESFHLGDLCSYSKVSCIDHTGAHLTITNFYACSLICTNEFSLKEKVSSATFLCVLWFVK